ncbi:hypothetical protein B0H34DRAFT_719680 [Crassisporium funariophilum]|nr:hypothetical protein B0H34DRAFT_719680 [Crassisporium funariophilum]
MPTQVQRRPSEPILANSHVSDKYPEHDPRMAAHKTTQQQQQHREALRLALGSILTPKRPPLTSGSRSSSGTASPAYPFSMGSGAHTPAGTPPAYYSMQHGPNSSDYLHPHHGHLHHGHPHPPSRLGRSNSNSNSPSESTQNSAPNSALPSPKPAIVVSGALPSPHEIEPLPPAYGDKNSSIHVVRPHAAPLQVSSSSSSAHPDSPSADASDHGTHSGSSTPRSKFLQTLSSKSAWDALIHGSFS